MFRVFLSAFVIASVSAQFGGIGGYGGYGGHQGELRFWTVRFPDPYSIAPAQSGYLAAI